MDMDTIDFFIMTKFLQVAYQKLETYVIQVEYKGMLSVLIFNEYLRLSPFFVTHIYPFSLIYTNI